ncbi:MAG: hypothetical protein EB830_05530 [Nitrosopumilus sp. H13]|nr:MAG: hypothetical protein EB830_05530 [Nitrosopumilus sp. H13]
MLCQTCLDSGITIHAKTGGCSNCGREKIVSIGRCSTCYQYYRKHGADRVLRTKLDAGGDSAKQCSNCGVASVVSKGRCSACYQYFRLHKMDIDPEKARARSKRAVRQSFQEPETQKSCIICGRNQVVSKERCSSCYQHFNKHGEDRDPEHARMLYERAFRPLQRQCIICGRNQVVSKDRCSSCYQHFNKHGEDRSKERTRMIVARALRPLQRQCIICNRNQVVSKDRCSSCYQYFNKHGEDRDPERVRQLYERSLLPPKRRCSNCHKEQVTSKGRCAACYQYFRMHGKERNPEGARTRTSKSDRRQKDACVNGCTIEPRTWAERLWQKPYYGTKPNITTLIGDEETPIESGWLCATHYARWKKYPCAKRPPPEGAKNSIRAYPRGMWICKGRTLSDPGPCVNVPLKLERFDGTGELDYGKKEPDNMDTYLDGLCQDCRNAEQGVIYDKAVEIGHDPHPTPKLMKRALGIVLRNLEAGTAEPADDKTKDTDAEPASMDDAPAEEPLITSGNAAKPGNEKSSGGIATSGDTLDWGPSLEDL